MISFSDLCRPAQVYIVLTILSLIPLIFTGKIISIIFSVIFGIIFTLFMNWLCSKGYPGVAWFLTLLPFIVVGLGLIFVTFKTTSHATKAVAKKQQQGTPQPKPHNS